MLSMRSTALPRLIAGHGALTTGGRALAMLERLHPHA